MIIKAEPLNAEAFAPFGDVLDTPLSGRTDFVRSLSSRRPHAWPSIGLLTKGPEPKGPFVARQMERHEYSSQTFIPTSTGRWLVLVAPHDINGKPDMDRARAFVPTDGQGVTFGPNVWHHGLTVFDKTKSFAIVMWIDGTKGDAELVDVQTPVTVEI